MQGSFDILIASVPQAVWLEAPSTALQAEPSDWRWTAFLFVLLCAAVATVLTWLMRRHQLAQFDPIELAFRKLAFRTRIGRAGKRAVRELSSSVGAPPVVLLISESSFDRAAANRAVATRAHDEQDQISIQIPKLRRRLFSRA